METRTIALGVILGTASIANASITLSFGELFSYKTGFNVTNSVLIA